MRVVKNFVVMGMVLIKNGNLLINDSVVDF